jgi:hypothetical protein
MNYQEKSCPICGFNSLVEHGYYAPIEDMIFSVRCLRCGTYKISERAFITIPKRIEVEKRHLASSKLKSVTNDKYLVEDDELRFLAKVDVPSLEERAINIVSSIAQAYPDVGSGPLMHSLRFFLGKDGNIFEPDLSDPLAAFAVHLLSVSYSKNWDEVEYLLLEYLQNEVKYMNLKGDVLVILPKGLTAIGNTDILSSDSNIVFIAMRFQEQLIDYSKEWFEGSIRDAGYKPVVMYSRKHTNLIDLEMKELIQQSKFVLCDLTANSCGAYYEAGFAHGLDKPVLFLCESDFFHRKENKFGDDLSGVHFDTSHYPIIEWHLDKGEELKTKLTDWIIETVGKGSNKG